MLKLTFSDKNNKLKKLSKTIGKRVYHFGISAGKTCPAATLCKAHVTERDGKRKVIDGKQMQFRCFAASLEALYKNVYEANKRNARLCQLAKRNRSKAVETILASLPRKLDVLRLHWSGDFANIDYFLAWRDVATTRKDIVIYGYTKMIPYLLEHTTPDNFRFVASYGGKYDNLIDNNQLIFSKVVQNESEAGQLGLVCDYDDSHAYYYRESFALPLHGTQPAGSNYSAITAGNA